MLWLRELEAWYGLPEHGATSFLNRRTPKGMTIAGNVVHLNAIGMTEATSNAGLRAQVLKDDRR